MTILDIIIIFNFLSIIILSVFGLVQAWIWQSNDLLHCIFTILLIIYLIITYDPDQQKKDEVETKQNQTEGKEE